MSNNVDDDDDDDYMSDKFLFASEKHKAPSLVHRQSDKREVERLKKKAEMEMRMKEKNKSARVIEQEKREQGLSSAISTGNKGFEMLMKMGYKPGRGIGKTESGIAEPIGVDVKANRMGLGKSVRAASSTKKMNPIEKLENLKTDDFRVRVAHRNMERLAEADLVKSQRACEQLDTNIGMTEPRESWYWPTVKKEEGSDSETDDEDETSIEPEIDELTTTEKLEILTLYLRDKYFYCGWCGATYDDQRDLRENCPGGTRNDH